MKRHTVSIRTTIVLKAFILVALLGGLELRPAWGETLIKEDFGQTGGDRSPGEPLHQVSLPNSQAHWICKSKKIVFAGTPEDSYAAVKGKGQAMAAIETPSDGTELEIEALVQPSAKGWVAIGMGKPQTENDNTWSGGIFFLLNSNGGYQVFYNGGTLKCLSEGTRVSNFVDGDVNSIRLTYDRNTRLMNCFINERPVGRNINLEKLDINPDLSFVGISAYDLLPDTKAFKSFSVTTR